MANNSSELERIIERISKGSGSVSESESGGLVFEFVERAEDGGLVYEASDVAPVAPENSLPESNAPELVVPDVFSVEDKFNTPATSDYADRIRTTYVPQFTEASENYRMKDDPRPRRVSPELTEVTRVQVVEAPVAAEPVPVSGDGVDPTAELDKLEGRLDTISKLSRKYGATVSDILAFREEAAARLFVIDTADERIGELEEQERTLSERLLGLAATLTQTRTSAAAALSDAVQEALAFLDMPKVRFSAAVTPTDGFTPDGMDNVEFLISTNPGEPLLPMIRIASGGELSRIMLAIRSVLNERYGVPTSIYDEVDTGISGRTARKVGIKLAQIAKGTQVICVTHSAQVASLADAHYLTEKQETDGRAETTIRKLDSDERVDEIARILGGLDVTDSQRESARELIAERERL